MGQKVNPVGLRLGINRSWESKWFGTGKQYADSLHEDLKMRKFILKELSNAEISLVEITRYPGKVTLNIYTSRPGIVIGNKGQKIDALEKQLRKFTDKSVHINIKEIAVPEMNASLIGQNVARQISGRRSYRRAMKMAIQRAMEAGAKGVKITCSGRLGGAEMKRKEMYKEGRIPLHTLRADIDFARIKCQTTYGIIGIKVWVFKGEVFERSITEDAGAPLIKKKGRKNA